MARVEYRLSAPTPPLCFLRKWEGGVLQKRLSSNDQARGRRKRSSTEFRATGRMRRGERVGYVAPFETDISKRRLLREPCRFRNLAIQQACSGGIRPTANLEACATERIRAARK